MTDDDLISLVDSTLGPVLRPAGFELAHGGWDGFTWWTPQQSFAERFGWLPQARPEEWQRGRSTDLTVEFDQTTGRLAHVHLEDRTVASTLYVAGHGELAAEVKAALPLPLADSLPVLARGLAALFSEPESRLRSEPFVEPA